MDPSKTPCPHPDSPLYGQRGQGNVRLHSKKENRLRCRNCNKTFARPLWVVFEGFGAYVDAFRKAFRSPLKTGNRGRPRLVAWPGILLGRVIKHRTGRRLDEVERCLVQEPSPRLLPGSVNREAVNREAVQIQAQALLARSQGGGVLNTAYIERLNATFRSVIASLARRTRALARTGVLLEQSMYLAGWVYNFCTEHRSLAVALIVIGRRGQQRRLVGRTPVMAAGLTDHCWSVRELLNYRFIPQNHDPG